jgi:hypothetical protein
VSVSTRVYQGVEIPRIAKLFEAEQPISEQQVPLSQAVRQAFACPDCLADVLIPRVIRLHDPTCITLRRS